MAFALTTSSFGSGESIPIAHTADGEGLSPPLAWADVPRAAKSLALIVEDLDAPSPQGRGLPFTHWVVYNVQPSAPGIPLGASDGGDLPAGAIEGRNDGGAVGYLPPRPPEGRHRFAFRLLALDRVVSRRPGLTSGELLAAISGHVVAEVALMAFYAAREDVAREGQTTGPVNP
ncbi:MAG TPA: YbhB/YbcL family Raf kinase inhibitor-like protein [Polyangia bacterium]|jgi:Raf kinase inhibitor-like YbhB/YbcL family protein|nr:YbhB/YbcL family Raf kinase inhibitor-like protein [Polyangia bacterium]